MNIEEKAARLMERLKSQPELMEEVEGMLDEVENRSGELKLADDAEDALVERMRRMGHAAMSGWANRRHEKISAQKKGVLRREGKKNFGG